MIKKYKQFSIRENMESTNRKLSLDEIKKILNDNLTHSETKISFIKIISNYFAQSNINSDDLKQFFLYIGQLEKGFITNPS